MRKLGAGLTLAMLLVSAAHASADKQGRLGLGMNLGRADLRYDLDQASAVDGYLNFNSLSGDAKGTTVGLGGYYLKRLRVVDPVSFNFIGGAGYDSTDDGAGTKTSGFAIFGGVSAEYFLPGTKSLSLEAGVGLKITFGSTTISTPAIPPFVPASSAKATTTEIGIADLTGGTLMLRYYFD